MNILISLFLALGTCAGLTVWQQQSLERVRAEIAALSGRIAQTRAAADEEETALASLRKQLRNLETQRPVGEQNQAALDSMLSSSPETEGWWPSNRPYFYLDKKLLRFVRLRGREIPNRLFQNGQLNRWIAVMLGMTDAEKAAVGQQYAELERQVHALETAQIQYVQPPQPGGETTDMVARIPSLAQDVNPLLKQVHDSLDQTLGSARTESLEQQAGIFFNQYEDALGAAERTFVLHQNNLTVKYTISQAPFATFKAETYFVPPNRTDAWEYSHLFGPGAPCEIKAP